MIKNLTFSDQIDRAITIYKNSVFVQKISSDMQLRGMYWYYKLKRGFNISNKTLNRSTKLFMLL